MMKYNDILQSNTCMKTRPMEFYESTTTKAWVSAWIFHWKFDELKGGNGHFTREVLHQDTPSASVVVQPDMDKLYMYSQPYLR